MELNSRLYSGSVFHKRLRPKEHKFRYPAFMFCLDLDELSLIASKTKLFSHNGFGIYNFRDSDHLDIGAQSLKTKLKALLTEKGYLEPVERVELLANPSVFGFVFNPLSVYFCYLANNELYAVVAEVCNNFFERKVYVLDAKNNREEDFTERVMDKNFFISPYCRADDKLHFMVKTPGERLDMRVNTISGSNTVLETHLGGDVLEFSDKNLLSTSLYYPFYSLSVFARIHMQALRLLTKGVPYFEKDDLMEFQKDVYRPHKTLRRFLAEQSPESLNTKAIS